MNRIIYPKNKKIYVVSSIKSKFNQVIDFVKSNEEAIFIFNGGICYGAEEEIDNKIKIFESLKNENIYYNADSTDLIYLKKLKDNVKFNKTYNWIIEQKLLTKIDFVNQTTIIVVAGGINGIEKSRVIPFDNMEICFISHINNIPWHEFYNGEIGYIISNNPPCKEVYPKFYNYSCSIGLECDDKVIVQEVDSQGLKDFLIL